MSFKVKRQLKGTKNLAKLPFKALAIPVQTFKGTYKGIKIATGNDPKRLKDPKIAAAAGAAGAVGFFAGTFKGAKSYLKTVHGAFVAPLPKPARKAANTTGRAFAPVGALVAGAAGTVIGARYGGAQVAREAAGKATVPVAIAGGALVAGAAVAPTVKQKYGELSSRFHANAQPGATGEVAPVVRQPAGPAGPVGDATRQPRRSPPAGRKRKDRHRRRSSPRSRPHGHRSKLQQQRTRRKRSPRRRRRTRRRKR